MTAKEDHNTLVALESFVGQVNGEERLFRVGDVVRASDPAVKKWPALFGVAQFYNEPKIEQATAAPGELRGGKVA